MRNVRHVCDLCGREDTEDVFFSTWFGFLVIHNLSYDPDEKVEICHWVRAPGWVRPRGLAGGGDARPGASHWSAALPGGAGRAAGSPPVPELRRGA